MTGHKNGPSVSKGGELYNVILKLDKILGNFIRKLNESHLLDKMNIILTADHGMVQWNGKYVNLDHLVDRNLYTTASNGRNDIVVQIYPKKGISMNWKGKKRIFCRVMMRIGKVEPDGKTLRSGPSFSEIQVLPWGLTFFYIHLWPCDWLFFCLSTWPWFLDVIQYFIHVCLAWCCVATLHY